MISSKLLVVLLITETVSRAAMLDLSKARVLSPTNLFAPVQKAVTMLVEEVAKRTQVHWDRTATWRSTDTPIIAVGPASALKEFSAKYFDELSAEPPFDTAEGYRIRIKQTGGTSVV